MLSPASASSAKAWSVACSSSSVAWNSSAHSIHVKRQIDRRVARLILHGTVGGFVNLNAIAYFTRGRDHEGVGIVLAIDGFAVANAVRVDVVGA